MELKGVLGTEGDTEELSLIRKRLFKYLQNRKTEFRKEAVKFHHAQ